MTDEDLDRLRSLGQHEALDEILRLRAEIERNHAWHDKPTCPGLWIQWLPGIGNTFEYVSDYTYSGEWGGRWHGPIPKDSLK